MKKVFCRKCKYFEESYFIDGYTYKYICEHPDNIIMGKDFIQSFKLRKKTPEEINFNNDCKGFEQYWIYNLIDAIKGLFKINRSKE